MHCARQGPLLAARFRAMGSACELLAETVDAAGFHAVAQQVEREVARIERKYTRYGRSGVLALLRRRAGRRVWLDAETAGLIDIAAQWHERSAGLFDITGGTLQRLWRFERAKRPPDATAVERALAHTGFGRLHWDAPRLELPPGMELDLGGVVKEYAADRAAALCRDHGIEHGLVNLGGDIRVIGPAPDGRPWQIGVRHPRREDAVSGGLSVREGGVATSGDYERCIVVDGVRYGHILNPLTGWPVRHLASVTVIGPYCLVAGSASTVALLKEGEGPQWLQRLGFPHVWVDAAGEVGGTLGQSASGPR